MNCPSRTDADGHPEWNQSPPSFPSDLTTRADLNGITNLREVREHELNMIVEEEDVAEAASQHEVLSQEEKSPRASAGSCPDIALPRARVAQSRLLRNTRPSGSSLAGKLAKTKDVLVKYAQFVGPGFLIAVAYIDPGNYATDVSAGAATRYSLLFIVLMSNLFAIFLQTLCIKLGSVTGLNLAENCRRHLPRWLCLILYILSEAAIIATDIAEVIGSAIALNLLLHVPLVAGCAITLVDVLFILLFYRPDGSMASLRVFEYFIMALVFGVVICFCIQLSYVHNTSIGEVFRGYVPSSAVVRGNGIYLSCGILGATVMPHSLFLGSGVVQSRLRQFDLDAGSIPVVTVSQSGEEKYRPSMSAIRSCLKYSVVELATSLFTFALFVNSAILIVAGSSLYGNTAASKADLFGIHDLLSHTIAPVAGTIFALALLLSGTSAGIVCTMAGQMVSEGMLNWTLAPWLRRLLTRAISITPSIIIAAAVGKGGLNTALTATQAVLSVMLPFVSAPLLWFTCRGQIMTVNTEDPMSTGDGERVSDGQEAVNMRNGWVVTVLAVLIWTTLVVMNVSLLVLLAMGKA